MGEQHTLLALHRNLLKLAEGFPRAKSKNLAQRQNKSTADHSPLRQKASFGFGDGAHARRPFFGHAGGMRDERAALAGEKVPAPLAQGRGRGTLVLAVPAVPSDETELGVLGLDMGFLGHGYGTAGGSF